MLSNNQYRQLIVKSYYRMFSTDMAYAPIAMDIRLLDELMIPDGYMEGESFQPDLFDSIQDQAVRRIGRFLKESVPIRKKLKEANHFMDEEIDEFGDPPMPVFDGEADRHTLLGVLLVYTFQDVSELADLINDICELNGDPPIKEYANAEFYDDENVRIISLFYKTVLEMFEEFKEEVLKEDEKRRGKK